MDVPRGEIFSFACRSGDECAAVLPFGDVCTLNSLL